jgi:hypothetical protein
MSISRNTIGTAILVTGLLAASSALAPAFAQLFGVPNQTPRNYSIYANPGLRITHFNFGLRSPCDKDGKNSKEQVIGCTNNLIPAKLGDSDTKRARKSR